MAREKLLGSPVPRVYTKPLRKLEPRSPKTEQRTLGYDVIDFAREVLGIDLDPWQQWLVIHMLELRKDGSLRFRNVVVLVARQNGKSTLSQVLALWFMIVWEWPMVLGTAQKLDIAEEIWSGAVALMEENDQLSPLIKRVVKVNGGKALELIEGSRYKVQAASRRAGRGLTANLVLLDELREHKTWDAWGAITNTTMARTEALILALSNAGESDSIVLRHLRRMAHKALGDPDGIIAAEESGAADGPTDFDLEGVADLAGISVEELGITAEDLEPDEDSLAIFEWSAPPGCDVRDRDGWRWANPSLGRGRLTERALQAALVADEWVFRAEQLCQWPDGTSSGPFPPGCWSAGQNEPEVLPDGSRRIADADRIVGSITACVDMSPDRSHAYLAVAGFRADGVAQIELRSRKNGDDWVKDYLTDLNKQVEVTGVTGQGKGAPISTLITDLAADPEFRIPVEPLQGAELLDAYALMFDMVRDVKVRHHIQQPLDLAAETAATNTLAAGAKLIDRRNSTCDAAPLQAAMGALWLLMRRKPKSAPPPAAPQVVEVAFAADETSDLADLAF